MYWVEIVDDSGEVLFSRWTLYDEKRCRSEADRNATRSDATISPNGARLHPV